MLRSVPDLAGDGLKGQELRRTLPAGLEVYTDFLSPAEQLTMLSHIDSGKWTAAGNAERRVQQYGFEYHHATRELAHDPLSSIPSWLSPIITRIENLRLMEHSPNQVIINEYLPGQGIRAHVDNPQHFGPTVISLSLGSKALMRFTALADSTLTREVLLEPGSLVVMSGESRYRWRHEIPAQLVDSFEGKEHTRGRRVSVTLRNVIHAP